VRSTITVDLAAVRHNVERLREIVAPAEVWAVVKADAYGHGAADVARAAVAAGVSVLCVATVGEASALRAVLPEPRILVLGPVGDEELAAARAARVELTVVASGPLPEGLPLHVELDTGMGRWGLSELVAPGRDVVGLMTHFAASEADEAFTRLQLRRFLEATASFGHLQRHAANSAAALGLAEARLDAVRCGIALLGVDPFGVDATEHGLRPVLRWETEVVRAFELAPGESTGYGRRFVAETPTRVGIVPVGYADGLGRALTGTAVLVDGQPSTIVGTISMDAAAVLLPRGAGAGSPVVLVGDGVTLERHAAVAGTIAYELACGIRSGPTRAARVVVG
jgi:alanine racemase